ncbi:hypothetical protein ABZS66_29110 [Dactylosporangium sp. NPDC005572]|uniref:hypothetical protein n=1 Tax=Dactylosporangium sp. NPDC005572 TaxID=3156889 RepID=UPI0033B72FB5
MQAEQAPLRSRSAVTLAVALVVLLGAAGAAYLVRRHVLAEARSLNTGDYESWVGLGVDVGQVMTYGDIIMTNDGRRPIVIERAELLTNDAGAVVEEVRLLDVDAVPVGTLKGEALGYAVPVEANAIPGATMQPSQPDHRKHYQLIFVIRVSGAEATLFHSVRISYRIADRKFEKVAGYRLRLCTPKGVHCSADRRGN